MTRQNISPSFPKYGETDRSEGGLRVQEEISQENNIILREVTNTGGNEGNGKVDDEPERIFRRGVTGAMIENRMGNSGWLNHLQVSCVSLPAGVV